MSLRFLVCMIQKIMGATKTGNVEKETVLEGKKINLLSTMSPQYI